MVSFYFIHTIYFCPSLFLSLLLSPLFTSFLPGMWAGQEAKEDPLGRQYWYSSQLPWGKEGKSSAPSFNVFFYFSVSPLLLLSLLSCCLVGTNIESWPCVTCFPFVPASYSLHLPTSLPWNQCALFHIPAKTLSTQMKNKIRNSNTGFDIFLLTLFRVWLFSFPFIQFVWLPINDQKINGNVIIGLILSLQLILAGHTIPLALYDISTIRFSFSQLLFSFKHDLQFVFPGHSQNYIQKCLMWFWM